MADLSNVSDFSYGKGFGFGKDYQALTYLYGLSDFWQYLFQDTSTNNLLLETNALAASDIYSNFLQLCSGISIADIAESASSQIRLQILSNSLSLPTNVSIYSGTWLDGFSTIKVSGTEGFVVGDTIEVYGARDLSLYDIGNAVNTNPVNEGGLTSYSIGSGWNGIFTITDIFPDGSIRYYQPVHPGAFTSGAAVRTLDIGVETYQLPEKTISSRFISNKPFLPTITLEENVDYYIDSASGRISFAKPLSSYGFPSRLTPDGFTEYSVWFVDTRYDEDLMYSHFPLLLGRKAPTFSNTDYRNFLYGIFYVYTSGPSVSVISKGLNLALGIPLARDPEVVLEIRQHLNTNQFIVITDLNSYITPLGLVPSVAVGDTLAVGDEIARWIEVQDHQTHGSWWTANNITIPPELMPNVPTGYSRLVTGRIQYFTGYGVGNLINDPAINNGDTVNNAYSIGDYADWVMSTYLKNNTFLIKIGVSETDFALIQKFESIHSLLMELKPAHTYPIYLYSSLNSKLLLATGLNSKVTSMVMSRAADLLGQVAVFTQGLLSGGLSFTSAFGSSAVRSMMMSNTNDLTGVTAITSVQDFWTYGFVTGVTFTGLVGDSTTQASPEFFTNYTTGAMSSVGTLTPSVV